MDVLQILLPTVWTTGLSFQNGRTAGSYHQQLRSHLGKSRFDEFSVLTTGQTEIIRYPKLTTSTLEPNVSDFRVMLQFDSVMKILRMLLCKKIWV